MTTIITPGRYATNLTLEWWDDPRVTTVDCDLTTLAGASIVSLDSSRKGYAYGHDCERRTE